MLPFSGRVHLPKTSRPLVSHTPSRIRAGLIHPSSYSCWPHTSLIVFVLAAILQFHCCYACSGPGHRAKVLMDYMQDCVTPVVSEEHPPTVWVVRGHQPDVQRRAVNIWLWCCLHRVCLPITWCSCYVYALQGTDPFGEVLSATAKKKCRAMVRPSDHVRDDTGMSRP